MKYLIAFALMFMAFTTSANTVLRGEVVEKDLIIACESPVDVETAAMIAVNGTSEDLQEWVQDELTPCWSVGKGSRYSFIEEYPWSSSVSGISLYRFAEPGYEIYDGWSLAVLFMINSEL